MTSNDPILPSFTSALGAAGLTTTQQSSAEGLYATLTGRVSGVNIGGGGRPLDPATGTYRPYGSYNLDESMWAGNMFFQDRWRLTSNLTLNYRAALGFRRGRSRCERRVQQPGIGGRFLGTDAGGRDLPAGHSRRRANPQFTAKVHAYKSSWVNPQPAIALAWSPQTEGFLGKILPAGQDRDPHRMVAA